MRREHGQAGIETLVALPLVLVIMLAGAQAVAWAACSVLADTAASAGARALVRGSPVDVAARGELPGPFRRQAAVTTVGGVVRVVLRVPSLVPGLPVRHVTARARP
jgi:hypothetical protein